MRSLSSAWVDLVLAPPHPDRPCSLTAAFFVGSVMLIGPLLPTGFIPPDDLSADTGDDSSLPPGSTLTSRLESQRRKQARAARSSSQQEREARCIRAIGGGTTRQPTHSCQAASVRPTRRRPPFRSTSHPRGERSGVSKQDDRGRVARGATGCVARRTHLKVGLRWFGSEKYILVAGERRWRDVLAAACTGRWNAICASIRGTGEHHQRRRVWCAPRW